MMKMVAKLIIAVLLVMLWVSIPAFATGGSYGEEDGQAEATSEATATAEATAGSTSYAKGGEGGYGGEGGASSAANEGNNTEINSSTENNSSNTVLVPNNNTENCLRVFGIAWGKNGESGALGLPWRSKKCDFEQAADDAFAAGERESGWFWKCQNSNLYKQFKKKNVSTEMAQESCLAKMVGEVRAMQRIETLTTQLTEINTLRENELTQYRESRERLTEACNDSKNRMLESCKQDK